MAEAINSARAAVSAGVRPFHTKREERRRAQTTPLVFFPFLWLAHCESLSERSSGRLECSGCKRFSTADELLRLARPSGFFLPSPRKPLWDAPHANGLGRSSALWRFPASQPAIRATDGFCPWAPLSAFCLFLRLLSFPLVR